MAMKMTCTYLLYPVKGVYHYMLAVLISFSTAKFAKQLANQLSSLSLISILSILSHVGYR